MKLAFILLTGLMLFSALYSPQVVYPVLIDHFSISAPQVALLQTATFFPLAASPILYGIIIDRFSAITVLRIALLFLAVGELCFSLSQTFTILLASRFLQGLFIPAAMTAIVSFISTSYSSDNIQKYISYYMASTMAGGVAGRVVAGYFSTVFGWRYSFSFLGGCIFIVFIVSLFIKVTELEKTDRRVQIWLVLGNRQYLKPIFTVFFAFIVFSSIMNFYSIRIKELSPSISEFMIGVAYVGSLFGALTAYMTPRFASLTGGYKNTIVLALFTMLTALLLFQVNNLSVVIGTLFLFCGAFIVVHTSCSGLLNKHADVSKGSLNGVYFTIYYFGGVIGSFLPGYIYSIFGWKYFLYALMLTIICGLLFARAINIENKKGVRTTP